MKENFNSEYELFLSCILKTDSPIWNQLCLTDSAKNTIVESLKAKREFGIKKYGEKSFQGTFENAMNVDVLQHAREELVDYLNYTLHRMYQTSMTGNLLETERARKRFQIALTLLYDTI